MSDLVTDLAARLAGLPTPELHASLRREVPRLSLAERFDLLHRLGVYHHPESFSGEGSTLAETSALRSALPRLVADWQIESVLDIPCGDFHWMREVEIRVDYTGADIVPSIVQRNEALYGRPNRRFRVLDVTRGPLPRVDLVLCRDLLIHLSLDDCRAALRTIVASGSRLLLANHYRNRGENPDILSGDFRPINLLQPPFSLPAPLLVINERSTMAGGAFEDRSMALWRLANLAPTAVDRAARGAR